MILLDDGTLALSPSDLTAAATCEFALARHLDALLGRAEPVPTPVDDMLTRVAALGDRHEREVLDAHLARVGRWDATSGTGVAMIARPSSPAAALRAAWEDVQVRTLATLRTGADVVYQAGFFDGRFIGWADFLLRDDAGVWTVVDTKLARHARVPALVQLAAYADQLHRAGVPAAPDAVLVLGNRAESRHRLGDLLPVYRERRRLLEELVDAHRAAEAPAEWGAPGLRACGSCEVCQAEVRAHRDVLLVAGLRSSQRARLAAAGITTIDALAAAGDDPPVIRRPGTGGDGPGDQAGAASGPPGPVMARSTWDALRRQARLQVTQEAERSTRPTAVTWEIIDPLAIARLPEPDPGDIFFDFEGDPLWLDPAASDPTDAWGLEYLFGVVEPPVGDAAPVFRPFWAHDRAEERQALVDFLDYVTARRAAHPGMHVYHYAAYERSALLRLAGRHGVGEQTVDDLLRHGVLVDLYATVRAGLRIGQESYSLKKVETLYLTGDEQRSGEVTTATGSVTAYAQACASRDAGDDAAWRAQIDQIADYNRDDVVSTLRLRDWLLARGAALGALPGGSATGGSATGGSATGTSGPEDVGTSPDANTVAATLLAYAGDPSMRTPDQQAVALLAAATDYFWREHKPFWWAHFDRLTSDPDEWLDQRNTFHVEQAEVVQAWHRPPRARVLRRTLHLTGQLEAGSDLRMGSDQCFAIYDPPLPPGMSGSTDGHRGWSAGSTVEAVEPAPDGERTILVVTERLPTGVPEHDALPIALTPGRPPDPGTIRDALVALAGTVAAGLPDLPDHPALDLLRRLPPRLASGATLPRPAGPEHTAEAITAALADLDHSYLAVQGPPGTGKTHIGAQVIADLVRAGWRIGVVAQSHEVVEHMLRAVIAAGVDPAHVAKKPAAGSAEPRPWTLLTSAQRAAQFWSAHGAATAVQPGSTALHPGAVMGGTTWDLTHPGRLPAEGLDLVVVDEAGQFSLAPTIAVSAAAPRLLLLGDPQQLPQVSHGTHPEPVDRSALGWLMTGHDTLPDHLGYFLPTTWRMHPALCAVVSRLSYDGRLAAEPCTAERRLDGVAPGVRVLRVAHTGRSVMSPEEAEVVVEQVRDLVGRRWTDPAAGIDRPLAPADVLVVAAYNAQVWAVRRALDTAGLDATRVGTVDKFQGQQAPVVLVTTAASAPDDVPRGMEFLLNRNRVNVAISRAQWCAVVVRSTGLTDYLPSTPERLAELGAFLGLERPIAES